MHIPLQHKLQLQLESNQKHLALLIDPDKVDEELCAYLAQRATAAQIDMILVGGSLLVEGSLDKTISVIKEHFQGPVIIFPGNNMHISPKADALLLLSVVSGRNPELLIGQHVAAAPMLKKSGLEIIPTAYLLIDGGKTTAVHYLSNTMPIPHDKPEIASATALAAQMLGLQWTYLEAGSGALRPVRPSMIRAVKQQTKRPLLVGGGINDTVKAEAAYDAGADILVVGTAIEKDLGSLEGFCDVRDKYNITVIRKV